MCPERRRNYRINFTTGVVNGTLFIFGAAFMHPTTILPAFLQHYTDAKAIIGLASVLHVGGWCLPQILAANVVERLRRKKPLYMITNATRLVLTGSGFVAIFGLGKTYPGAGLAFFIILFGAGHISGGIAGLCFHEMVGALIPTARRGAFFSWRFLLGGGVMSILAGMLAAEILSNDQLFPFPFNYEVLFGLGLVMMTLGIGSVGFMRETSSSAAAARRPLVASLMELRLILKADQRLRRIVANRLLAVASRMSWPFYIVFAQESLRLTSAAAGRMVGILLIAQTAGGMLGNLCWGRISSRHGNRRLVLVCSLLEVLAPLFAVIVGVQLVAGEGAMSVGWLTVAFVPVFAALGASVYGAFTGAMSYVLEIAPEGRRPTYIGILNTATGLATVTPVFAGLLAGWIGLLGVFSVSACVALAALVVGFKLPDDNAAWLAGP